MRPKKFYCADLMSPRTAACQQRLATWRALVLLAVMLPALALAPAVVLIDGETTQALRIGLVLPGT